MQMTVEEFDREFRYQTVTYFVRQMLEEGLISEDEFRLIDGRFREKYQPVTGALLSGKFLLCVPNRANICTDKEAQTYAENTKN